MVMLLSALSVLLGTITAQAILTPTGLDSKAAKNVLEGKAEGYCSVRHPLHSSHCLCGRAMDSEADLPSRLDR